LDDCRISDGTTIVWSILKLGWLFQKKKRKKKKKFLVVVNASRFNLPLLFAI